MIFKLCNFERYYRHPKEMKSLFWRDISTPMFIAALFTVAKYGNKCLLIDEQIKAIYIHTYIYIYIYIYTHTHTYVLHTLQYHCLKIKRK